MDISELKRQPRENIQRHPWEITRARIILFLLKKKEIHPRHILDVGSGDAFVLRYLVQHHMATLYTAVDTAYTEQLTATLKNHPSAGTISFVDDIKKTNEESDCVLLLDVLEHCENDKAVLQESVSGKFTATNSLVMITVPAFQSLFSQHDHLLHHYRRYSRKQIAETCKTAGLHVIGSGYFFFSLLPVRLAGLLLEKLKLRKTKKSIDNWEGSAVLTRFISSILWADFRLCFLLSKTGIHLPGLSCYCLCKKQP